MFLYPYAMSFVATGPGLAVDAQSDARHAAGAAQLGLRRRDFDWIVRPETAIYTLVIATVWQASGLVMALLLAGLRGIDDELWKAARIDGIPRWRVYVRIVMPMLGRDLCDRVRAAVAVVVKLYDLSSR